MKEMLRSKKLYSGRGMIDQFYVISNGFMGDSYVFSDFRGKQITEVPKDKADNLEGVIEFERFIFLNDTTEVYIDATFFKKYNKLATVTLSYKYTLDCENFRWVLKDSSTILY